MGFQLIAPVFKIGLLECLSYTVCDIFLQDSDALGPSHVKEPCREWGKEYIEDR